MSVCISSVNEKTLVEIKCHEDLVEFNVEIYKGNSCVFRVELDNIYQEFDINDSNISFYVRRTPQARDVLYLDNSLGGGIRWISDFTFEFEITTESTKTIPAMEYMFFIKLEQEGVFIDECKTVAQGKFIVLPSICD